MVDPRIITSDDKEMGFSIAVGKSAVYNPAQQELTFYKIENNLLPHIQKKLVTLKYPQIKRVQYGIETVCEYLQTGETGKYIPLGDNILMRYEPYQSMQLISIKNKNSYIEGISLTLESFGKLENILIKHINPLLLLQVCSGCRRKKENCPHDDTIKR
jgi:hypothetical protein